MTELDLERWAQRRLAVLRHVEEVSFNVAAICRYHGISRRCYCGWLRRYEADGLGGLNDRSNRLHHQRPQRCLVNKSRSLPLLRDPCPGVTAGLVGV